jgi:hypothetical protein
MRSWWHAFWADRRWRRIVRKNRARHLDLVEREEWDNDDPIVIANLMLIRERRLLHEKGVGPDDIQYPDLYDFFYLDPPSRWKRDRLAGFRRIFRFYTTGKL